MGSLLEKQGWSHEDEGPVHKVKIRNSFYISKYPFTQKQWEKVTENNPSNFKGESLPVEYISWNQIQEFLKMINEMEGNDKYRLPSEAEWEYSCRAGTTTNYYFSDDICIEDYAY